MDPKTEALDTKNKPEQPAGKKKAKVKSDLTKSTLMGPAIFEPGGGGAYAAEAEGDQSSSSSDDYQPSSDEDRQSNQSKTDQHQNSPLPEISSSIDTLATGSLVARQATAMPIFNSAAGLVNGPATEPGFEEDPVETPKKKKLLDSNASTPIARPKSKFLVGPDRHSSDSSSSDENASLSAEGLAYARGRRRRREQKREQRRLIDAAEEKAFQKTAPPKLGKYHSSHYHPSRNFGMDGACDEYDGPFETTSFPVSQAATGSLSSATDKDSKISDSVEEGILDKTSNVDPLTNQEKFAARIAALRAKRNADGPDGRPAKNRTELLEARRNKLAAKQQANAERRVKDREQHTAEEEARRLCSGKGDILNSMSSAVEKMTNLNNNNLSFGRIAFDDGTSFDTNGRQIGLDRHRGPSDPGSALAAQRARDARLSGLDPNKKAAAEEADRWSGAIKRANGASVKDDPSLLKRTLKKQTAKKEKGRKQWAARSAAVEKAQVDKQKKREENLAARKHRPGFEGKKGL